jgi:hypothetical protein
MPGLAIDLLRPTAMAVEPPASYIAFVERHLEPLRRDAERFAADPLDAERLYTEVLTDVAARWAWLEIARTRLGRPDAAEQYLRRSFDRRTVRPEGTQDRSVDVEVWDGGTAPPRTAPVSAAVRLARQAPALFRIAIGPLVEAAVAWQHAYAAAQRRRLAARIALGLLAVVILARVRLGLSGAP